MDRLVLGCGGAVAGCPRGRGWPRGRWPISVSRVGRLTITPSRSPACMFVRHRAIGGGGRRPTDTSHTSKTRCNLRAHARQIFLVWSPQIRDIPGSGHTPIQIFQGLVEYPFLLVPVLVGCRRHSLRRRARYHLLRPDARSTFMLPASPMTLRASTSGSLPDREHPGPASRVTQRRIATPAPQGSSQGGRR
jgi:hypothetical protein